MRPATAANAAPKMNVIEMVRSTLMPSSAAIFMSCSQARCARPSAVLPMSHVKPVIRATVVSMIRIWMLDRETEKPSCCMIW